MSAPWHATTKDLNPVSVSVPPANRATGTFIPPSVGRVAIAPPDLFKSMARCAAAKRAPTALVAALVASAKVLCEFLVDDASKIFAVTEDVLSLADAERTALSGRIGAGITNMVMEDLRYTWCDLAEEVIWLAPKVPLADFVHENSAGAVVLAEAKGSISIGASSGGTKSRAVRAYQRQVDPHVYTAPPAPRGHPAIGTIAHGYAIAFAALPGPHSPAPPGNGSNAFATVAETGLPITTPSGGPPAPGATGPAIDPHAPGGSGGLVPPTVASCHPLIALGNFRAVFVLANAPAVVRAIDSLLLMSAPADDRSAQTFVEVECGGSHFLIGAAPGDGPITALTPFLNGDRFAVTLEAAQRFLTTLMRLHQNQSLDRNLVELAVLPLVRAANVSPIPPYLQSPDGFALLRQATFTVVGERRWQLDAGLGPLAAGRGTLP